MKTTSQPRSTQLSQLERYKLRVRSGQSNSQTTRVCDQVALKELSNTSSSDRADKAFSVFLDNFKKTEVL